jgi:hypothetical protein
VASAITDSNKRDAILKFIRWGLTEGQDRLEALSYARLPSGVVSREEKALANIKLTGTSASADCSCVGVVSKVRTQSNGAS